MDSETFHTAARVGEIAEGRGKPCAVEGRSIAVILDGGTYYAIDAACPHKGAPLCDGLVFDGSVICARHGWRFSLADGRRLDGLRHRVETYAVRVIGDEIQVSVR
ncbi:MAG: Rieske (2Fe-2S) protein [Planctomycetaceae bacterium]|nr:Rieske (2Fe-2S) protein [Planctomycetaceae bacterium]